MQKLRDVVIVAACRTPIGTFGGSLKDVRSPHLAAAVMKEVIKRSGIDPAIIEDVRMGCCMPDIDAMNVARVGALLAGIPNTVPAVTINRVCTSGMECVHSAAQHIAVGFQDVILAGGVESMSYQPYVLPTVRWGTRMQDGECIDRMIRGLHVGSHFVPYPVDGPAANFRGKPYIMGMTAEFLAMKYKITREEQDIVACRSHNNAQKATQEGRFADEIVPIEVKQKKKKILFDKDEHFSADATVEKLGALPPAFIPKVGTVTAGNASGLNDGASALLLMSREKANALGLKVLASVRGLGKGALEPEIMGVSPAASVRDLLRKTGGTIERFERIELNEAFAAQYLACEKELQLNREITNVNGSGIGLGHPVGSTGSRIIVSLMYELMRSQKKTGLATICGGGGISLATEIVLE